MSKKQTYRLDVVIVCKPIIEMISQLPVRQIPSYLSGGTDECLKDSQVSLRTTFQTVFSSQLDRWSSIRDFLISFSQQGVYEIVSADTSK